MDSHVKLTYGFMIKAVTEPKEMRTEAKIVKEECYHTTIRKNARQQNPTCNHGNGALKKVKMKMNSGGANGR